MTWKERIEKLKQNAKVAAVMNHVEANKKQYIAGAGGLLVGGAVASMIKRGHQTTHITNTVSPEIAPVFQNVVINALGDPGNVVQCLETGTVYASQNQAARELGVAPARISEHLAGKLPHVQGNTLQIIAKAVPAA